MSESRRHYPSTMERAFELAESGECRTLGAIERKLRQEGHDQVLEHLSGPYTRQQLRSVITQIGCRSMRRRPPNAMSPSVVAVT